MCPLSTSFVVKVIFPVIPMLFLFHHALPSAKTILIVWCRPVLLRSSWDGSWDKMAYKNCCILITSTWKLQKHTGAHDLSLHTTTHLLWTRIATWHTHMPQQMGYSSHATCKWTLHCIAHSVNSHSMTAHLSHEIIHILTWTVQNFGV